MAVDPVDQVELTDEVLAELIGRQEVSALEQLYHRHARAVYSLALSFLKLWRQPELYQVRRGKLLPWLLGVAHHRSIDRLRRRRLEQRHSVEGVPDLPSNGEGDPERHVWGRFQVEAVGRALAELPPTQRQVLEMAYLGGMTHQDSNAFSNAEAARRAGARGAGGGGGLSRA
jgi:RNA polymerase sigma-70 factor (ECF subfamily)